jgi:flagellar assembly protein FliH
LSCEECFTIPSPAWRGKLREESGRSGVSTVVKLHMPAGSVRMLRTGSAQVRKIVETYVESSVASESVGVEKIPATAPVSPSALSTIDEFEERLKVEFKAGFDEGRRQTEKHLRGELERKLAETQTHLHEVLSRLQPELERFRSSAEKQVVKLALAIAERIVKREVATDNELVVRQIGEAVKRIVGIERMKIRVNPKDEALVREYRTSILASTDAVRELAIEADETIARGGCIIESDSGNVDALLVTQIERIEVALLGGEE